MTSEMQLVAFVFVSMVCQHIQARKFSFPSMPSSATPEIWLSSFSEVDSFEVMPAEEAFRRQSHFHNDFIFKNETDYVVLDGTEYAVFSCRAPYPVHWTIPHMEQVDKIYHTTFETSSSRTAKLHQNQLTPTNKYFETFLTIRFTYANFINVNFACEFTTEVQQPGRLGRRMSPQNKSSSIHVYLAGQQAIENVGTTVQVYVPLSKEKDTSGLDTVIFPCRPATPNVTILLEKQVESKNDANRTNTTAKKWIKFKVPSKYVDFDPKKGFILLKNTVGRKSYIFGLYRCIALEASQDDENVVQTDEEDDSNRDISQSQFLFVNVSSERPEVEDIEFKSVLNLRGNASVRYNEESFGKHPITSGDMIYDNSLICCSGLPGVPPEIYSQKCDGPLQCKMLKHSMSRKIFGDPFFNYHSYGYHHVSNGRDDCGTSFLYDGALMVCKARTLQFAQLFVDVFHKDNFPMKTRVQNARTTGTWIMNKFDAEEVMMRASLSQKIFLTIGYPVTHEELLGNHKYNAWIGNEFSLIRHRNDQDVFVNYDSNVEYEVDTEFAVPLNMGHGQYSVKIAEYSRDVYYEGEPLVVFCVGWRSMYADGAHLSISWSNGTISVLEEPDKQRIHFIMMYFSDGNLANGNNIVYRFGRTVTATKHMVSVHCNMPQVSSDGWDTLTRNLTVLEPSLPKWVGGEGNMTEEVVYLYLGDEQGKQLECHVASGAPEPKVNVTKDGKQILDRQEIYFDRHFSNLFNVTVISNDTAKNADNVNDTTVLDEGSMITIVIRFAEVSLETGGVYQCIAMNVRGKVTRTFRVVVTERKGMGLLIFFSIIIISVVLLLGVGARLWLQRKHLAT